MRGAGIILRGFGCCGLEKIYRFGILKVNRRRRRKLAEKKADPMRRKYTEPHLTKKKKYTEPHCMMRNAGSLFLNSVACSDCGFFNVTFFVPFSSTEKPNVGLLYCSKHKHHQFEVKLRWRERLGAAASLQTLSSQVTFAP